MPKDNVDAPMRPAVARTGAPSSPVAPLSCAALLVLIVLLAWFGIVRSQAPAPVAADAPPTQFSSERAMRDLRRIAAEPHPLGTAADARVRQYLVERLVGLGLTPEVHAGFALSTSRSQGDAAGAVHNVLVRLPGKNADKNAGANAGKAVLLMAHYDSVPTGPGAADNASSVAAILETLRALRQGAPLDGDVMALFSDGEEPGMLGANAFVDDDPWRKNVGLVLNFDFRGTSGAMTMFETSAGNGALIAGLARSAGHPIGSSLVNEVKKLLPNETDMTPFKRAGIAGLNFAAFESAHAYHTELDSAAHLDQASLQHEGELMLALTRHFAGQPLSTLTAPDRVYFDVAGTLFSYPEKWVPALSVSVLALLGAVLWLGVRRRQLRWRAVLLALPGFIVLLAVLAGASQLSWSAIQSAHPQYRLFIAHYNAHWYLLAFAALVTALAAVVLARTRQRISAIEAACGAMLCWAVLLVAGTLFLPGVTFLLTWPLLPLLAALALLFSARGQAWLEPVRLLVWLAGAALAIVLFAPLVRALYIGLGPKNILVPMAVLVLLLGILAPLLAALVRVRWFPLAPLGAAAVCFAAGSLSAGFDAEHPRPSELAYFKDTVAGQAFWLSSVDQLDAWTTPYLSGGVRRVGAVVLSGTRARDWRMQHAPDYPVAAPAIAVLYDRGAAGERQVGVRVRSLRHAPRMTVGIDGDVLLGYSVHGKTLPGKPRPDWWLNAYAMPDDTLELHLRLKPGVPVRIHAADRTYGLASVGVSAPPSGFMSYPFGHANTVQASTALDLPVAP